MWDSRDGDDHVLAFGKVSLLGNMFMVSVHLFIYLFFLVYFLRARGEGAERGGEDLKRALSQQQRVRCGARTHEPRDHALS